MSPLEQQTTPVENTQAGSQQAAAGQSFMSEYMSSLPSLAKKIETGNISSPDLTHDVALTFEDIYQKAGGGAAGTAAEDTFQKALNNQLKSDGSSLQLNTEHTNGFVTFKQNAYAIEDSQNSHSSGFIVPERAEQNYKEDLARDARFQASPSSDATNKPADAGQAGDTAIPKDSDFSFSDPKTEQAYQQAAGDAAKVLTTPGLSDQEKAQGVIDAMNEVKVGDNLDLSNFEHELSQKLGPQAHIDIRPSVAMSFHAGISIDTGDGKVVPVPFISKGGRLVSDAQ